jgi:hypothetical protein
MIQTFEAVVDRTGTVTTRTALHLKQSRRALVTILDEEPKVSPVANIEPPTNESVSDEDVLSVWADRKGSASEIAGQIRKRNRNGK